MDLKEREKKSLRLKHPKNQLGDAHHGFLDDSGQGEQNDHQHSIGVTLEDEELLKKCAPQLAAKNYDETVKTALAAR